MGLVLFQKVWCTVASFNPPPYLFHQIICVHGKEDAATSCLTREYQLWSWWSPRAGYSWSSLAAHMCTLTFLSHHISDVQYSCFLCCTKFLFLCCTKLLFSVMYNIPDFNDVQYSWFQWCTIFLYSAMYNIPVFHVVPFSPHNQWCTLVIFIM